MRDHVRVADGIERFHVALFAGTIELGDHISRILRGHGLLLPVRLCLAEYCPGAITAVRQPAADRPCPAGSGLAQHPATEYPLDIFRDVGGQPLGSGRS